MSNVAVIPSGRIRHRGHNRGPSASARLHSAAASWRKLLGRDFDIGRQAVILRCVFILLAAISTWWAATAGLEGFRRIQMARVTQRTWAGEEYKRDALLNILQPIRFPSTGTCLSSEEVVGVASIRFALARTELEASAPTLDETLKAAEETASAAIACAPHQASLWFLLFWTRTLHTGFDIDNLPLLWMSYRLGGHEAWVQRLRGPFAMEHYEVLPAEGQYLAISDFRDLVSSGHRGETAAVYVRATPALRSKLAQSLDGLPSDRRQTFANDLRSLDLKVELEGVRDYDREEWQKYLGGLDKVRTFLHNVERVR